MINRGNAKEILQVLKRVNTSTIRRTENYRTPRDSTLEWLDFQNREQLSQKQPLQFPHGGKAGAALARFAVVGKFFRLVLKHFANPKTQRTAPNRRVN